MTDYPPRPRSERSVDLGFAPQNRMVRWLSPRVLARTAGKVLLSAVFGSFADKREIEGALEPNPELCYAESEQLWIDFVADLGDAFGPTYTIASLLASPSLDVGLPDGPIPRGRILVMGGDQVYPFASILNYENHTLGPYRAALPYTESDHPHLYGIPGNHDWYDGLTAFMRIFCREQWVGGWSTRQKRSYFAVQLPQRWWLWGIDVQFESWIDEVQFRYFKELARDRVHEGDSIILCSASPSWVQANLEDHEAYVTIDYLERKVIRGHGAEVRLALTGDSHHYARYEQASGAQKITSGGGGAYLSATHRLPETLLVPPPDSRDPGKTTPAAQYRLMKTFPDASTSKGLRWSIWLLPFKNVSFWVLLGGIHVLYALMIHAIYRIPGLDFSQVMRGLSVEELIMGILRSPLALLLSVALVWGLMGFTNSKNLWKRSLGVLHGLCHLLLIVLAVRTAAAVVNAQGPAFVIGFLALLSVVGGLVGSWLMALYLLLADSVGCNTNELFSAQRVRDHKNFVRLHIGPNGLLTVYPLKVERTPRRWKLREGGNPDDPWLEPDGATVQVELIEAPVVVTPMTGPPKSTSA